MLHSTPRGDRLVVVKVVTNQQDHLTTTAPLYVSTFKNNMIRVITKLPKYINRQNQSTTGKL
jgi:hypothetical protein